MTHGRVTLRAIERSDLALLRDWRNELLVTGTVRQWHPLSMADQEAWFEAIQRREEHIMLAVTVTGEAPRPIGVVGLTYIDWIRRRAEISVYIGPESLRGEGYGRDALGALCDYGFGTVGMHRIYAEIFASNAPSIRLFESLGFVREGAMREHHFFAGKWIDSVMVGLLANEWRLP